GVAEVSKSNVEREEEEASSEDEHSPMVDDVGESPEYNVQLSTELGLIRLLDTSMVSSLTG
ncbi:hypothetical protein, partial [Pseudophaeobacter profundi]|uniref:hypothetical protein n=1 Tax=Pseudophaeobacter profundi TaxID=3034152 RepID=UPI00242CC572